MTIHDLLIALCEELAAEGVPDVLHQPVTLAALWDDLARLAGSRCPAGWRRRSRRRAASGSP